MFGFSGPPNFSIKINRRFINCISIGLNFEQTVGEREDETETLTASTDGEGGPVNYSLSSLAPRGTNDKFNLSLKNVFRKETRRRKGETPTGGRMSFLCSSAGN